MAGSTVKEPSGAESGRAGWTRECGMRGQSLARGNPDRAELSAGSIPEEHDVVRLEIDDRGVRHDQVVQSDILVGPKPMERECAVSPQDELVIRHREYRIAFAAGAFL